MRRNINAGLLLCLLSISEAAFAQSAPAETDAGPTRPQLEEAMPTTVEPSTPLPMLEPPAIETLTPPLPAPPEQMQLSLPSTAPTPRGTHHHWYGWQNLLVDAAALAVASVAVSGVDDDSGGGAGVAFLGIYLLGGPIVHFAHGQLESGLASFGLRSGLPSVGGMLGCAALSEVPVDLGCYVGVVLGVGLGILTAIIIDAAVLAYEEVPDAEPSAPQVSIAIDQRSAGLVASGMF